MSDSQTAKFTIPQPEEVTTSERNDAMGSYLMFVGVLHVGLPIPFLSIIGSAIYHGINAKKSRFTAFHSYQALMSGIGVALFDTVWVFWGLGILIEGSRPHSRFVWPENLEVFWILLTFGLILTLVYLIITIVAAVRAYKGRMFYMWFFGRLAYERYYGSKAKEGKSAVVRNEPPKGF